jgi:hypothetical protein
MNMADKTSPSSVPATPKREVKTVAAGEAIPTARILGKSMMFSFCGALKEYLFPRGHGFSIVRIG